jgi:hypothetical protein
VTAVTAIVVDRATGEVLGAKNPDAWGVRATKMMTGLAAAEVVAAGDVSLSTRSRSRCRWASSLTPAPRGAAGRRHDFQDLLYMTLVSPGRCGDRGRDARGRLPVAVEPDPETRSSADERKCRRAAPAQHAFVDVTEPIPGPGANDVDGYEQCTAETNSTWRTARTTDRSRPSGARARRADDPRWPRS